MFFPGQIERTAGGGLRLRFSEQELLLLHELLAQLEVLLRDPDDAAVRRLFPPAHADRENEEQYRSLVRDQLVAGRSQALTTVRETLGRETLTADEADAWLRALNDVRLVLGTRLDVTEETDFEGLDPTEPRGRDLAVYAYLSWLQEQLVESLEPRDS
ncbi:MAG TPA: DUF2017 family protein [Gaiellaceae bacterium]|nr:DUF2017 family protein [Gaiellaceae bacterium]